MTLKQANKVININIFNIIFTIYCILSLCAVHERSVVILPNSCHYLFIYLDLNILIQKNKGPLIIMEMAEKMIQFLHFLKKWRKKDREDRMCFSKTSKLIAFVVKDRWE